MYNQYVPKIPRLTKLIAEQYIATTIGVPPHQLKFTKMPDIPPVWRHSCVPTGVTILTPTQIYYTDTLIVFVFCNQCGKVQYHYEITTPVYF